MPFGDELLMVGLMPLPPMMSLAVEFASVSLEANVESWNVYSARIAAFAEDSTAVRTPSAVAVVQMIRVAVLMETLPVQ